MTTTAVTASPGRSAIRDPVLLLPAVVAAGLGVGWLGVDAGVSGWRIAADLALAWTLVAASLLVLERPRWRSARVLLGAAAFALLAADLEWASSHALSTIGLALAGSWAALLVQLVVTFPEGRSWSRFALPAIAGAYVATLGGQLVGIAVSGDVARTVERTQQALGIAVALAVLVVAVRRLHVLPGPARRAQGPLFAAAAITAVAGTAWLARALATGGSAAVLQTIVRVVAVSLPIGVMAGISWSRLRRPVASELVVELRTGAPATIRDRLARALGDPTLDVAYRLGDGRYVDAAGREIEVPGGPDRAVTSLTAGGDEIAALVHDPALLDEPGLVESVRATAGLVLENERLAAEVRSQLAEVRASRGRIVAAADAERRRIERNLHDGAQQRLVTLSVMLGLEASRAGADAAAALGRAQGEVEEAIAELRELARGIHPVLLRDEGLEAAVAALARRTPLPVTVSARLSGRVADSIELAAYFVVAEALTNVAKHASAAEASVVLEHDPGALRISVSDDGAGGARIADGSGLAGLCDRLEALDATLTVESPAGHGTTIRATFPCAS